MVIWKFPIEPDCKISMPTGAQILSAGVQFGQPCIWAMVDPDAPEETRYFRSFPTGKTFDPRGLGFIATIQGIEGSLVFHVFEVFGQ